jgi:hypothetical protein
LPGTEKIVLFYKVGSPISSWMTYAKESEDGGLTWGAARELVPGDKGKAVSPTPYLQCTLPRLTHYYRRARSGQEQVHCSFECYNSSASFYRDRRWGLGLLYRLLQRSGQDLETFVSGPHRSNQTERRGRHSAFSDRV